MALSVSSKEQRPGVFFVSPVGSIDSETYTILENKVDYLVQSNPSKIVFNMEGVEYISSAGVRIVLKTKKALKKGGGKLILTNLKPNITKVFDIIKERAERYYSQERFAQGYIISGDSRNENIFSKISQDFKWIITSPPYYGMRTYIPDQWLRLWFLGGGSKVNYSALGQITHNGYKNYTLDLRKIWKNIAAKAAKNANLIVRFGSISSKSVDTKTILKDSFLDTGWAVKAIRKANFKKTNQKYIFDGASNGPAIILYFRKIFFVDASISGKNSIAFGYSKSANVKI